MQLSELLSQARIELDDVEQDYLWSDAELKFYINEAVKEAVRRSRLIVDASTTAVCSIAVTAGTQAYSLHASIYKIIEVLGSWDDAPLRKWTAQEMKLHHPTWRTDESDPCGYVLDYESGKLWLNSKPKTNGTLSLRVYRFPLVALSANSDTPEINPGYHEKLIHWVRHKAYLKPDTDTFNKQASMDALALFEQEFGPAKSVWSDEFDNRNLPDDLIDGQY